jgi:hypothetical protein
LALCGGLWHHDGDVHVDQDAECESTEEKKKNSIFFLTLTLSSEAERANSDYAKQIDYFWDREKYQALFNHGAHGAHDEHHDAAHNSRFAEVTNYVAVGADAAAPAAAAHGKPHH